MPFQCPLCDGRFPDDAAYGAHLADAHGLVDDEGATSFEPERVDSPSSGREPGDIQPIGPSADLPAPPPAAGPRAFSPLEPSTPTPGPLPPPPLGWLPPAPAPHLPPPPSSLPPWSPSQPDVSKRTIVVIVAGIVVAAVLAMALVSRSSSTATSSAAGPAPDASLAPSAPSPAPIPVVASSRSPADSVDPVEARTVAAELWSGMTGALSRSDTVALRVFEDGPLLESDIGSLCKVGCPPQSFSPIESVTVNVPHQTGWPAVFLATITYASGCHSQITPCVNQFVAVQPAKDRPWKATELINYGGQTLSGDPQFLPDGFAVTSVEASSVVPALLADFANYESTLKTTGQKPSSTNLEDGAFTSDRADQLFDPPETQQRRGIIETTTYSVDLTDPIYTFATGGGTTTSCGTIRYTAVMTSADGSALPAYASVDEWQIPIAAGTYRSMTLLGLHMVCFGTRTTAPTSYVVASWGDDVAVSGEHA